MERLGTLSDIWSLNTLKKFATEPGVFQRTVLVLLLPPYPNRFKTRHLSAKFPRNGIIVGFLASPAGSAKASA